MISSTSDFRTGYPVRKISDFGFRISNCESRIIRTLSKRFKIYPFKKLSCFRTIPLISLLAFLLFFTACSPKPPEQFFRDDILKMVMIDHELGFKEEVTGIKIVKRTSYNEETEVQLRITGWATHPELTIGAVLPASTLRKPSWAVWKYFCRKVDKEWVIDDKYKVDEGFE